MLLLLRSSAVVTVPAPTLVEEYQGGFWSDGTSHGTWARKKRRDEEHAEEIVAEAIEEVLEDIPASPYVAKKPSKMDIAHIKQQAMAIAKHEQSEQYAKQQVIKLLQQIDEEEALIMLLM